MIGWVDVAADGCVAVLIHAVDGSHPEVELIVHRNATKLLTEPGLEVKVFTVGVQSAPSAADGRRLVSELSKPCDDDPIDRDVALLPVTVHTATVENEQILH